MVQKGQEGGGMCSLRRTAPALAIYVRKCYTSALVLQCCCSSLLLLWSCASVGCSRCWTMLLWQAQEAEAKVVTVACMCKLAVSSICHRGCFTRDV
jgi:hypothetical protein